jgi:hypothetical protein
LPLSDIFKTTGEHYLRDDKGRLIHVKDGLESVVKKNLEHLEVQKEMGCN